MMTEIQVIREFLPVKRSVIPEGSGLTVHSVFPPLFQRIAEERSKELGVDMLCHFNEEAEIEFKMAWEL